MKVKEKLNTSLAKGMGVYLFVSFVIGSGLIISIFIGSLIIDVINKM